MFKRISMLIIMLSSTSCRKIPSIKLFSKIKNYFDDYSKVNDLYKTGTDVLLKSNISDAEDSARYLLADVLQQGYKYSTFQQNLQTNLNNIQRDQYISYIDRRLQSEPVQYIIGNWDFYGYTFECRPPVLIPRPETEELVEYILKSSVLTTNLDNPTCLDIGAGTGAIGISLSARIKSLHCQAIDISPVAVNLSNRNAQNILGLADKGRYSCQLMSFLDFVQHSQQSGKKYDLIVSNPPYIPSDEMAGLQAEVRCFEDERALHGGLDGLDIVRQILEHARDLLSPTGSREVWLEVSSSHPQQIERWLKVPSNRAATQLEYIEGIRDLSGKDRFVRLRLLE